MQTNRDEAYPSMDKTGKLEACRPGWIEDENVVQWLHGIYFANCHIGHALNTITEVELENADSSWASGAFWRILFDIRDWCTGVGFQPIYWHVGDATKTPHFKVSIHQWVPAEMQGAFAAEIERLAFDADERLKVDLRELDRQDEVAGQAGVGRVTMLDRNRLVPVRLRTRSCPSPELAEQWDEVRQLLRGRVFPSALMPGFDTVSLATALKVPAHPTPDQLSGWCCGVSDEITDRWRKLRGFRPQRWEPDRLRETVFPEEPYANLVKAVAFLGSPPTGATVSPEKRGQSKQVTDPPLETRKVIPKRVQLDRDGDIPPLSSEIEPSHKRLRWRPDESLDSRERYLSSTWRGKRSNPVKRITTTPLRTTDQLVGPTAVANASAFRGSAGYDDSIVPEMLKHLSGDDSQRDQPTGDGRFMSPQRYFKLREAAEFAATRGFPLNAEVTIVPSNWGIKDPKECRAILEAYLKRLATWFGDKRYSRCAWVYVWEKGQQNGCHVHLAIHVPDHLRASFRSWNEKLGRTFDKVAHRAAPIGEPTVDFNPLTDEYGQRKWLAYLGKQLRREEAFTYGQLKASYAELFGADRFYDDSGPLPAELGKLVGISQSLGPQAIKGFDVRPMLHRLLSDLKKRAGL